MYTPVNSCSGIIHLFLKHPILVLGLGLVVASNFVSSNSATHKTVEEFEKSPAFVERIEKIEEVDPEINKLVSDARYAFTRILVVEQGLEKTVADEIEDLDYVESDEWLENHKHLFVLDGEHPDGVSFGPAGLTRAALDDVMKKTHYCKDGKDGLSIGTISSDVRKENCDAILYDSNESPKFAYLYFLDLVHEFGNVKHAVISYNAGKTRIRRLIRNDIELPYGYYYLVMYPKIESRLKHKTNDDWFEAAYKLCPISNPTIYDYVNRYPSDHSVKEIILSDSLRKKYARKHFQNLLDHFKNVQLATSAYYYGIGTVSKALDNNIPLDFLHRVEVQMM